MKILKWRGLSAKFRISFGLVGLLVSILLTAMLIGLIPDRRGALREGRAALAETIAAGSSGYVARGDFDELSKSLRLVVARNKALLSAAVRDRSERIMIEVGEHERYWEHLGHRLSTETQVRVPIWSRDKRWGQIELRFEPLAPEGWQKHLANPAIQLLAFMSASSFLAFYFYLGKMLQHLDPSRAVPARVRAALDTMAEGLLVIDLSEQIVLANESFASMLGVPPDKLLGRGIGSLQWLGRDSQTCSAEETPWRTALRDGQVIRQWTMGLVDGAGQGRSFMVNCTPVLGSRGQHGGVLISFDDVTKLEQQSVELGKAKEEAEAANRSKSQFLANMSHEIRTPMNAILGFTEVLRRGYGKNQEDNDSYLRTIHTSGSHLLRLINDILDLSKVESGKMQVEKVACSPAEITTEVLQVLAVKAEAKGLTLDFQVDGRIPATIVSDPARLRQIITNLVGNAIKFTEQGSIRVISRLDVRGSNLEIDVSDTGIGLTPEQCERIFDPFTQADSSTSRNFGGTGLGLTISRKFAEALGGTVTVRSDVGRGSVFTITVETGDLEGVRLLSQDEVAHLRSEQGPAVGVQWRFPAKLVLVVDDSEPNRDLLKLVLAETGLVVHEAENGKRSLDQANHHSYDVILMDMQMPVMDGYTATRTLRDQGYKRPIYALTAHAMKGFEQECLAAGCSGYLTKPIDIDQLLASMGELLGGEKVAVEQDEPRTTQAAARGFARPLTESTSLPPLLSRLSDKPRFRPVIQRFAKRLSEQLEAMEGAWQHRNFSDLASLAHWLKGSGGTVGFDAFTEPAARLETLAKASCEDNVEATLSELRELVGRVVVPPAAELTAVEVG